MNRAFTLIETMVAVSLLTIAIVAPMLLTVQSLASAVYSRDQITAFYLAQEAIEEVHQIRDGQILLIALNGSGPNIFGTLQANVPFTVDAHQLNPSKVISYDCPGSALDPQPTTYGCPPLQLDGTGTLYGYGTGYTNTNFTRAAIACYVQADGSCNTTVSDEMRVSVTVSWRTGTYQARTFTLSEDLYRWIRDGSGT